MSLKETNLVKLGPRELNNFCFVLGAKMGQAGEVEGLEPRALTERKDIENEKNG